MSNPTIKSTGKSPIQASALIQLFPLAIGVNILAYGILNTNIALILTWLGFFLVFFILTIDSIVEYGAYSFDELPKSLYFLAILNTLSITAFAIDLGILLNQNFKLYSSIIFGLSFFMLALESLAEMCFCIVYYRSYSKLKFALYEQQDYKIYALVEALSVLMYVIVGIIALYGTISKYQAWVPYVVASLQLCEQFVWVKLKSKPNINPIQGSNNSTS